MADLTDLRAVRSFISGTWNGGGNDQSYAYQDGQAVNPTRTYQSLGPNGAVGVEGAPISTNQTTSILTSPMVLILGAVLVGFLVLRKG